jgi:hypothetical protein
MILKLFRIKVKIIKFWMSSVQRLNWNLHKRFTFLHHFIHSTTYNIKYCAPLTRNSKAFYNLDLIGILESATVNFHSLTNVCTLRMLGVDHCPRIFLEDEHRFRWTPEVVEEQFERDSMSDLRKLVDLLESMINLMLVLFHFNLLWFFEWVEVVRELQPAYSVIIAF